MKKSVLFSVILAVVGFTGTTYAAEDASATFTWSGTVPAAPESNGFIIKDSNGNDIERGILLFHANSQGLGELDSAETLVFNVYDYTDDVVGEPASKYTYELTSLQVNNGGLPQEQDSNGYFAITADSSLLDKNVAQSKSNGGATALSVTSSTATTPSNQPVAGDSVDVHARIVISDAAI